MPVIVPTDVGERIRSVRTARKLKQEDFASALGVGRASVARYELGTRTPDAEFIVQMNHVFGVDPMWMLVGEAEAPVAATSVATSEEEQLLLLFRTAPPQVQKAALGAMLGAATPGAPTVVIHGNVGQQVRGKRVVQERVSIKMGGSAKRK